MTIVNIEPSGRFYEKLTVNGLVNRRPFEPGRYIDATTWQATDVSGESTDVQAQAVLSWTPAVISAWQAAHPFVGPSADQVLTGKIFANARRKAIITAIQTSDDVQLAALIAARYPTLSGDAIKAVTDIFLTIAGYIRN